MSINFFPPAQEKRLCKGAFVLIELLLFTSTYTFNFRTSKKFFKSYPNYPIEKKISLMSLDV